MMNSLPQKYVIHNLQYESKIIINFIGRASESDYKACKNLYVNRKNPQKPICLYAAFYAIL